MPDVLGAEATTPDALVPDALGAAGAEGAGVAAGSDWRAWLIASSTAALPSSVFSASFSAIARFVRKVSKMSFSSVSMSLTESKNATVFCRKSCVPGSLGHRVCV